MVRNCRKCGEPFRHHEKIVAAVRTEFIDIPSSRAFAIEKPTECIALFHEGCHPYDTGKDVLN